MMRLKLITLILSLLLVFIISIPLIISIFSVYKIKYNKIVDLDSTFVIGKINAKINKNFRSQIILIKYHYKDQLNSQIYEVRELFSYGNISSHAITEFVYDKVSRETFKILDGKELRSILSKDCEYFTPVFVTHFMKINVMIRDINNNNILDIILRIKLDRDEFQDEYVCAYEVINEKVNYFWAYYLQKFAPSLCDIDKILFENNKLKVIVLKPLNEAFVIKSLNSSNKYIKTKVSLKELPYLWYMSISSIFSPIKFMSGLDL